MNKLGTSLLLIFLGISVFAQSTLPIIKAKSTKASMRDGKDFCKDCWTIMPKAKPDVWEVNVNKNKKKNVSLITDLDSITFTVELNKTYNFIVLLNGKDSAYTQIKTIKNTDALKDKSPYSVTQQLIHNSNFNWLIKSKGRYKYFYEKNTWADNNINYIIAKQDSAIKRALQLIHKKKFNDSIYSFFFDSTDKLFLWLGHETNAASDGLNTYHTCSDTLIAFGNHEYCHVVTRRKLGNTKLSIMEGIAVYADNEWHGFPLEVISKNILENKTDKDSLIFKKVYESWETLDWDISYPLAGSMFKYLYETYKIKQIKAIWKSPDSIEKITGKKFVQLDQEWKQFIKNYR